MARKLKPSPLTGRITQKRPLQHWLWADICAYDGIWVPDIASPDQIIRYLKHHKSLLRIQGGLCLIFDAPITLDPAMLGAALPLKSIPGNSYCSFDVGLASPQPRPENTLHLVQSGFRQSGDLTRGVVVDPLDFWDLNGIETRRSIPIKTLATGAAKSAVQHPTKSTTLAQIAKSNPVFAEIQNDIDKLPNTQLLDTARRVGRLVLSLFATIALIILPIVGVSIALGLISFGARGGVVGLMVAIAIIYSIVIMFTGASGVGPHGSAARRVKSRKKRGPGLFDHLKNWALWNTSLGNKLRTDINRHLNDVSRMIERGEVDKALKRAMALGAQQEAAQKRKSAPMTALPEPRGSLDLDMSGIEQPSASILSDYSFAQIRAQYVSLAQQLSADGDHHRAAFIYSELLKDVDKALRELELFGAFEDAAKLATARKSSGAVTARLWYLAGKKDIALALAKQFDALEYIANLSEKKDPAFSEFVRGYWIEELIGAGDLSRAVIQSADRPNLKNLHVSTLKQAVLAGLLDEDAVLVAATISLDWRLSALTSEYHTSGTSCRDLLERRLNQLIQSPAVDAGSQRHSLLTALPNKVNDEGDFWTERAPLLVDNLIRSALMNDSDHPNPPKINTLRHCAKRLGLNVIVEDLRHIQRNASPQSPVDLRVNLPVATSTTPHWSMLAPVINGCTIIGAANGELALLGKDGNRLWTDHMSDLAGIVPIGPGRLVILVQGTSADRTLVVLDTLLHSYRRLGQVQLLTWHSFATASSWLVQAPDTVGALDVSAMLDPTPSFDLLWSITQTVPVTVLGFHISGKSIRWMTQRNAAGQPGLIEMWHLEPMAQDLTVSLLNPGNNDTREIYLLPQLWMAEGSFTRLDNTKDAKQTSRAKLISPNYSYDAERNILQATADFFANLDQPASITALSGVQPHATQTPDTFGAAVTLKLIDRRWRMELQGAKISAQAGSIDGQTLVVIDDANRVICCDFRQQSVTVAKL